MEITLYRHPGHFGQYCPLDVFADEHKVASIQSGTSLNISIPDGGVTLRVEMEGALSSPGLVVTDSSGRHFECGTPLWLRFDVVSLCYLPFLKRRVFFLREASPHLQID